MSETNMPAAEATTGDERDFISYEFAFHVLPTVAEGEVPGVVDILKSHITKAGGKIFDEETPQRFDLAFEVSKYLEGKNRKFNSAYFGWLRFSLPAQSLVELTHTIDAEKTLLRYLLVKLTKIEEEHPFRFHESIADRKVRVIDEDEVVATEELAIEEEVELVEPVELVEVVADSEAEELEPVDDGKEVKETV